LISDVDNGRVYNIAGGAPEYISAADANEVPGYPSAGVTGLSGYEFSVYEHLSHYPAAGSWLRTTAGGFYRVAGGAAFAVSEWAVFGGEQPATTIDEWDLENASTEFAGLRAAPEEGTIVEGLPSDSYWLFEGDGARRQSGSSTEATQVNDASLEAFARAAPDAETGAAISVSPVEDSVSGSVNPDGEPVGECRFEYGPTAAYGSSVPCATSAGEGEVALPVSATISGLAPGTGYHFRVVAVGPGGTSDGADGTFVTASLAAPELGRCVKVAGEKAGSKTVYHGGFTSSNCEVVSVSRSGKYEWEPGVVKAGVALSGGATTLETVGGAKLTCTGVSGAGSYAAVTRIVGLMLHFTGCEQAGVKCSSSGSGAGEIASPALEGLLGIESKAKKKLALEVSPADKSGPLLQYACGANTTSVSGAVLVPVAAGKMAASGSLKFSASKGKQKPEALEGASKTVLEAAVNGGTPEQVGLTSKITLTNEETLENNPTV
jgi:hypothetical protein